MRTMMLTDEEVRLIAAYRLLSPIHQQIIAESALELAAPEARATPQEEELSS